MNKLLYVIVAVVAFLVGLLGFYKSFYLSLPEHALYYQQPRELKPFTLTDHYGKDFTLESLQGKWSWVFFGYTSCPDVCPTTLQELNYIYPELSEIAKTQILLVSVDPQRDSQEKLAQYIAYFNKEFIALRAGHEVLYPFARNMGLMYAITDDETDDGHGHESYLVDHSASIVLLNPEGLITAIFKPEQVLGQPPSIDGEKLLSDFEKIVRLN